MDQLIPSLAALVEPFRDCFHPRVFGTFQALLAGWIVCLGPRYISEVWQATGWAARRHHDLAYRVFRSALWEWDDLGILLATLILAHLVPGGIVWIVVDDTLCHKRGGKVAFGGMFRDAVLSSRGHKVHRFGINWVVLGIAVPLPMRPDRHFCLPVLWRPYRKKGRPRHKTRPAEAAAMARLLAERFPEREFWLVGDGAYINATTLGDRPGNLQLLGPIRWDAALYGPAPEGPRQGSKGRPRKRGDRLPTPKAMIEDLRTYPAEELTIELPGGPRRMRVQAVRGVLWYSGSQRDLVVVLLVRDPAGRWRDEALVATDPTADAASLIPGYCRRWSVECTFFDSKQFLGLHDPRVWNERSVERAHPMAWFIGSLTVLWYAVSGHAGAHVHRDRRWYKKGVGPTFGEMLGALRLQMWHHGIFERSADEVPPQEVIKTLLNMMSAVA